MEVDAKEAGSPKALREMPKSVLADRREAYAEKLRDPRWQKKRLEIFERDDWKCRNCGDTTSTLHVHHRRYAKGRDPWDYDERELVTLCEECHEVEPEVWNELMVCLEQGLILDGFLAEELWFLINSAHLIAKLGNPREFLKKLHDDLEKRVLQNRNKSDAEANR